MRIRRITSTFFLLGLLFLLGSLPFSLLELESVGVEFVDVEVVFFCKEAVDGNFEELHGFFPVLLQVGGEDFEEIGAALHVSGDFVGDSVDQCEPLALRLDLVEFHILDLLYYVLINLYELVHDAGMLELQHYLDELPQLQHVLRVVDVLIEQLFQVGLT